MPFMTFLLDDGTEVFIEAMEAPKNSPGLIPASRGGEEIEKPVRSFEASLDGVRKMSGAMLKKLRQDLVEEPSEMEVSFGLKASAEVGGFLVARTTMDANYAVTLKWKQKEAQTK
jgi:hypothetical protein